MTEEYLEGTDPEKYPQVYKDMIKKQKEMQADRDHRVFTWEGPKNRKKK